MKTVLLSLAGLILALGIIFGLQSFDYQNYKFWGPKYQNVQTQIYHNTDAFQVGNRRDLEDLVAQYHSAPTAPDKAAVLALLKDRVSDLPQEQVPDDVKQLINQGQ